MKLGTGYLRREHKTEKRVELTSVLSDDTLSSSDNGY